MEKITHYLSSLDWWFTVFIMGVLVNIVAYLLRKYISSGLSKISSSYSKYKNKRDAEIEEESDFLCKNPQLLICNLLRIMSKRTIFRSVLFTSLLLYILLTIMKQYISTDIPRLLTFIPLIFAIEAQVLWIRNMKMDTIITKAYRKFKKQRRMEQTTLPNNPKEGNGIV